VRGEPGQEGFDRAIEAIRNCDVRYIQSAEFVDGMVRSGMTCEDALHVLDRWRRGEYRGGDVRWLAYGSD